MQATTEPNLQREEVSKRKVVVAKGKRHTK